MCPFGHSWLNQASINLSIFFARADSRQSAKFNSHKFSSMRYVVTTLGTYNIIHWEL